MLSINNTIEHVERDTKKIRKAKKLLPYQSSFSCTSTTICIHKCAEAWWFTFFLNTRAKEILHKIL